MVVARLSNRNINNPVPKYFLIFFVVVCCDRQNAIASPLAQWAVLACIGPNEFNETFHMHRMKASLENLVACDRVIEKGTIELLCFGFGEVE